MPMCAAIDKRARLIYEREAAQFVKNSQALFAGLGSAVAFTAIFSLVASGRLEPIDRGMFVAINSFTSSAVVALPAVALTDLGSEVAEGTIAALIYFLSKPNRKLAVGIVTAIVVSNAIVFVLDSVYFRPRPYQLLGNSYLPVGRDESSSFPSGHSTRAFAIAAVVTVLKGRKYATVFIIAGGIALSRILVGVHFPLDITGGAFLGIALGVLAVFLTDALRLVHVAQRLIPV